jgi:hypothetical protein
VNLSEKSEASGGIIRVHYAMLKIFIALIIVTGLTLAVVYNTKFRNHPWDIYYPKLAWMRAGLYFCACYTLSYFTGGMELILTSPVVTAAQLNNPNWVWYTLGVTVFVFAAYSGLWSYFTPVFERKTNVLISGLFGFLWGSSSGQLFLSVWILTGDLPLPAWGSAVAAFLLLAMYQPNWHNIYWDHYIAPEHDTPMTQVIGDLLSYPQPRHPADLPDALRELPDLCT